LYLIAPKSGDFGYVSKLIERRIIASSAFVEMENHFVLFAEIAQLNDLLVC
jgi:hypothetical protein